MEDLNSTDAFAYIRMWWRYIGVNPPKTKNFFILFFYVIYSIFINVMTNVFLWITVMAGAFTNSDLKLVILSLSMGITLAIASFKHFIILIMQKSFLKYKKFAERLDTRASLNIEEHEIVDKIIKLCPKAFLMYCVVYGSSMTSFALSAALSGRLIWQAWFPFDAENKYYIYTYLYQALFSYALVMENISNDIFPPCCFAILLGHMRALNLRVSNIGQRKQLTQKENYEELINCIKDHQALLGMFDVMTPIIGHITFIQFGVSALIIGITAIKLVFLNIEITEMIATVLYLCAVALEVFPCCLLANEFFYESKLLTTSIFHCNWMDQDVKFRKLLIIFMQRTQTDNIIVAGGLIPLTIAQLINMLKFTFSLFTLFSSSKSFNY